MVSLQTAGFRLQIQSPEAYRLRFGFEGARRAESRAGNMTLPILMRQKNAVGGFEGIKIRVVRKNLTSSVS